jgi:hypothetical protein
MFVKLNALDFLLVAVAGLVTQHQTRMIEYLVEGVLPYLPGKNRRSLVTEYRARRAVIFDSFMGPLPAALTHTGPVCERSDENWRNTTGSPRARIS